MIDDKSNYQSICIKAKKFVYYIPKLYFNRLRVIM